MLTRLESDQKPHIPVEESILVNGTLVSRVSFGQGYLGRQAWEMIRSGSSCEARVDGQLCGKPGVGTTDYDFLGDAEQKVHCGDAHHEFIAQAVLNDLAAQGRNTVIGRNGNGRSHSKDDEVK